MDVLGDGVAVRGPVHEGPEDEHVEGAVEQLDPVARVLCHCVGMLPDYWVACLLKNIALPVKGDVAGAVRTLRVAATPGPEDRVVPLSPQMVGLRFQASARATRCG